MKQLIHQDIWQVKRIETFVIYPIQQAKKWNQKEREEYISNMKHPLNCYDD